LGVLVLLLLGGTGFFLVQHLPANSFLLHAPTMLMESQHMRHEQATGQPSAKLLQSSKQELEVQAGLAEQRGRQVQELAAQMAELQESSAAALNRAQADLRQAQADRDRKIKELQKEHETKAARLRAESQHLRSSVAAAEAAARSKEDQLLREVKSLQSRLRLAQQVNSNFLAPFPVFPMRMWSC
jgi:membrane-associated HD superfamily phosphohydrolase